MKNLKLYFLALAFFAANFSLTATAQPTISSTPQKFEVKGIIKELKSDGKTVSIQHEEIPGFMDAMTMPFRARKTNELAGLKSGDKISFRLFVTDSESWIEQIKKIESAPAPKKPAAPSSPVASAQPSLTLGDPIPDYTLTNELGKVVRFSQLKGQAFAFTFFFTRCPIPEYCPRLSKNFEMASRKLLSMPNAPTNWHFFSISFDPERDTPQVLQAYGKTYNYNPKHWSFLVTSRAQTDEITRQFGFHFKPEAGLFGHNFITVIVDANGILQAAWPIVGDTSENIVAEIVKGAAVSKQK